MSRPRNLLWLPLVCAGTVTACASDDTADDGVVGGRAEVVASQPVVIQSPVPVDFPDPFIIKDGATFHVYATNSRGRHLPHATSTDLSSWNLSAENDAMPALAPWVAHDRGYVWGPSVLKVSARRYVLFYAGRRAGSGQQCIGRAVANNPNGPFVDGNARPMICNARGWSIDPSPFLDGNGQLYLLWRQDVVAAGAGAMNTIVIRKLDANGNDFAAGSSPIELIRRTGGSWEAPVIENPAMISMGGKHFLFYSGNRYEGANYASGYAECVTAVGPCTKKTTSAPWFGSVPSTALRGPGAADFIRTDRGAVYADPSGTVWMSMHAWIAPAVGYEHGGVRALWLSRFEVDVGTPYLAPP